MAMQKDNFRYSNIFNAVKKILNNEGFFKLYSGLSFALGVIIFN